MELKRSDRLNALQSLRTHIRMLSENGQYEELRLAALGVDLAICNHLNTHTVYSKTIHYITSQVIRLSFNHNKDK